MSQKTPRSFNVYKSQHLVLIIEDQSGVLLSTAPPPPSGLAQHPWLNAQALDPYTEHELGYLVQQATDFDNLLQLLLAGEFDIQSRIDSRNEDQKRPHRIFNEQTLIGRCCANAGQYTTLESQPLPDNLIFQHATLTAYTPEDADSLLDSLQHSTTFDDLLTTLSKSYTLQALAPYSI